MDRRPRPFAPAALAVLMVLLACAGVAGDNPVPATLPKPDRKPPATDKPVKVYILSGQSNSLGFGRVDRGAPVYPSIYLSADPTIKTTRMPVGPSGLLPMNVFQEETGEARGGKAFVYLGAYDPQAASGASAVPAETSVVPLGDVTGALPRIDWPHHVEVKAWIEVPLTGAYEVHVGHGDSAHALATVDGRTEVYRKLTDGEPAVTKVTLEKGKRHALNIVYTRGGSAVLWLKLVDLKPRGTLEVIVKDEGRFTCLVDDSGNWNTRPDVMFCDAYMGKGRNGPLGAMWRGGSFGPELGFGYVMGTFHDEPVIVMKADIGNRSLGWDCLPPGSERYEIDGRIYGGYKDTEGSWPKEQGEPKPGDWYAGKQYDDYTAAIRHVLDNFATFFPQYKEQGYEVAGFVWWQGHKDQNPVHASRYEQNLVNLIKAWRKEFNAPNAKFAIATIAFGGWKLDGPGKTVAEAQLAVSDYDKYPEHKGNVKTIEARDFWRDTGESPKNQGFHYNHNGETYFLVGDALGRAMVEMEGGRAEKRILPPRPPTPDNWPENPTLEQAARMLYSNAFILPYLRSDAEPTAEDFRKMTPALRPIILDDLVADFVRNAPTVPGYLRRGLPVTQLISGEPPKQASDSLISQLDTLIEYYNAAGEHEYDWTPLIPGMHTAQWSYFTFDPGDGWEDAGRYRKVDLPQGMGNWTAPDFDAAGAGWKTGAAPFGQNNGQLKPLRSNCTNARCRCDSPPATLWDKEVLLIRQTFKVPPLKKDHRYRLVVGGGSHAWAGEGYAVYVNGRLFSELTAAYYKNGGERGAIILNDFLPDFASGEVTLAVKSFLRRSSHRGKPAPPTGHLSVWLEQAKLPPALLAATEPK